MLRNSRRLLNGGGAAAARGGGADLIFVVRHGERLDRMTPGWSERALRPQDSPLSERGRAQGRRLGKWLYGRVPVEKPLAIFCSPLMRCVQSADEIAAQLEGLQREGLFVGAGTSLRVEPGLIDDFSKPKLAALRSAEPWYMRPADLMAVSGRVDLGYASLRDVRFERGRTYPGGPEEVGGTPGAAPAAAARLATIGCELAEHPLVRGGGTAILVTHSKPATEIIRSLCPNPGGVDLPSHDDIKLGRYDGPPLQVSACTAMARGPDGSWALAPGFDLFSNEHDPRLARRKASSSQKVTRYVRTRIVDRDRDLDTSGLPVALERAGGDVEVPPAVLVGALSGARLRLLTPDGRGPIDVTLPEDYHPGDTVRCRVAG